MIKNRLNSSTGTINLTCKAATIKQHVLGEFYKRIYQDPSIYFKGFTIFIDNTSKYPYCERTFTTVFYDF